VKMFTKSNYLFVLSTIVSVVMYFFVVGVIISTVFITITFFIEGSSKVLSFLGYLLYTIGSSVSIFVVIYQLKKVIKSVQNKKPFTFENVKRFNIMAFSMLTFDALYLIYVVVNRIYVFTQNHIDIKIRVYMLLTELIPGTGSQITYLLIYFVLGCFFIIVGNIFKQAIDIKNENELTV